eukprot:1159280-Pelagomonas_calceolata.AAC.2
MERMETLEQVSNNKQGVKCASLSSGGRSAALPPAAAKRSMVDRMCCNAAHTYTKHQSLASGSRKSGGRSMFPHHVAARRLVVYQTC